MRKVCALVFCFLMICGCAPRPKVIEELQLIQALGYDVHHEDEFRTVAGSQIILPGEEEALPNAVVFSASGDTSRITRKKMQTESSKLLVLGRMNLLLFQDKLAEQGIFYFLDILQRDPVIGRNVKPAIVEGSVYDLLTQDYKLDITVYEYLNDLIEESEEEIFPKVTLHSLLYHYYEEGSDMYLPMIKPHKDRARVTGLALFKEDQCVYKLNVRQASYLKLLRERFSGGFYQIDLADDNHVSVENVQVSQSYTIKRGTDGGFVTSIDVQLEGAINELGDNKGETRSYSMKELEQYGVNQFQERLSSLVHLFQELEIDPLALGSIAKNRIRGLTMEEWYESYPSMDTKVNVELTLVHSGIIDESEK
ncbi:Ger(x)C family spore germination protein [Alkalihalobacillus sp. FSL R5-0424]